LGYSAWQLVGNGRDDDLAGEVVRLRQVAQQASRILRQVRQMLLLRRDKDPGLLVGTGHFLEIRGVAHADLQDAAADVLRLTEPILVHFQDRLQAIRPQRNECDALKFIIFWYEVQTDRPVLIDSRNGRAERQAEQL